MGAPASVVVADPSYIMELKGRLIFLLPKANNNKINFLVNTKRGCGTVEKRV